MIGPVVTRGYAVGSKSLVVTAGYGSLHIGQNPVKGWTARPRPTTWKSQER